MAAGDIARELLVKVNHLVEKEETEQLADLLASLREHDFDYEALKVSGLPRAGAWRPPASAPPAWPRHPKPACFPPCSSPSVQAQEECS